MWGRGPRGNNATCSALCRRSVTSPTTHNQIGSFWCWFPGGWVCVHSRTLWVSPTNSLVRLEISPTATSPPTGVFNQWFEALFLRAGTLACEVCLAPQLFLLVYLHANVGPPAPPAAPLLRVLSTLAASLCPSYQSGWMFLLYLLGCQTSIKFNVRSVLVVFCF